MMRYHCRLVSSVLLQRINKCSGSSRLLHLLGQNYTSQVDDVIVKKDTEEILAGVLAGNRAPLAKAITLVESKHPDKHKQAQWLMTSLLAHCNRLSQLGKIKDSFRIGLSGSPGAGKSTMIETLGKSLTALDHKVAVLAVDPTSSQTGGSILGDKTRMTKLASDPNAFIRPSPSGGALGGVTRNTQEAILLCEGTPLLSDVIITLPKGAGYDIIMVETMGVGQSEIAVVDMVDMFVLLVPPAAGDELQGMKKGIVELADLVVITKADGDLLPAARRIQTEYLSALRLIRRVLNNPWKPRVLRVSALHNEGVDDMWSTMEEYRDTLKEGRYFYQQRQEQQKAWLWHHVQWQLLNKFRHHPEVSRQLTRYEERVMGGHMTPGTAADHLIEQFMKTIIINATT